MQVVEVAPSSLYWVVPPPAAATCFVAKHFPESDNAETTIEAVAGSVITEMTLGPVDAAARKDRLGSSAVRLVTMVALTAYVWVSENTDCAAARLLRTLDLAAESWAR